MDKELKTEMRDYAWKYFSLHADQRIKTFNFYVILSTVIIGGILTVMKEFHDFLLVSPLAFILALMSFVFWKLDMRNKQLIKHAEDALKYIEDGSGLPDNSGVPNLLKLFKHEEYKTNSIKRLSKTSLLSTQFSYSTCFNAIFLVFGIGGLVGGIILVILGNV